MTNQEQNCKELIEHLHKEKLIYFAIVSLFSADTLVDLDACKKSLARVYDLERGLELSDLADDIKAKYQEALDNAKTVIIQDMDKFQTPIEEKLQILSNETHMKEMAQNYSSGNQETAQAFIEGAQWQHKTDKRNATANLSTMVEIANDLYAEAVNYQMFDPEQAVAQLELDMDYYKKD